MDMNLYAELHASGCIPECSAAARAGGVAVSADSVSVSLCSAQRAVWLPAAALHLAARELR